MMTAQAAKTAKTNNKKKVDPIMNELQVFNHPDFGEVSAIELDGKVYFPATKSAKTLGYRDAKSAISQHCRWVVKRPLTRVTGKGQQVLLQHFQRKHRGVGVCVA